MNIMYEVKEMDKQKRLKTSFLLSAVIYVTFGLVLALQPNKTVNVVCYLGSALVLAIGIYYIFQYFRKSITGYAEGKPLVNGLFFMGISVYAFFNIGKIMAAIPVILSFAIIYNGLIKLNQSLDMQKLSYKNWWYVLVLAAVGAIYGAIMLVNPFGEMKNLLYIGIGLVYSGVSDLVVMCWANQNCDNMVKEKEVVDISEEENKN